jgi:PAS domain S-box-containing protein
VQFYESDEYLVDTIVAFAAAGLAGGETVLIVATPPHWAAARAKLSAQCPNLARAEADGRLIQRDAAQLLQQFMAEPLPNAARFDAAVGELVRDSLKTGRPLRAFGEMVALLWETGNRAGAVAVEELWNDLAREHAFALFCAYGIARFNQPGDEHPFGQICQCHTRIVPAESYTRLRDPHEQERATARLQQKAQVLQAEIRRRETIETELRSRERELADFLENSIESLHQVDAHGIIIWANQAELQMLGYEKEEYVGRPIRDFHVDPDVIDSMLARLLRGEALHDCAARVRCKDGSIKHVLVHSNGLFENGRFIHSRCFTRDVTARKLAQEQQERLLEAGRVALAEAKRVSKLKDDFLATLSHELRTPLNAILGWAEIIKEAAAEPETVAEGIAVIERNVRAQARLIEDLLDMSRIVSGKLTLNVRVVTLGPFLSAAVDAVRPLAEAKSIALELKIDPRTPAVRADAPRLQQVVGNLLVNAIKFTGENGRVVVSLEPLGSEVEIAVADNGRGIDPAFLPHVFERFRQEDSSTTRKHGGLGIGLSIVKQLVELHDGRIRVESAGLGRGATFFVTLPIAETEASEHSASRSPHASDAGAEKLGENLKGARVLIVDDESDARELAARVLTRYGANVLLAGSTTAALQLMESITPDVLVSDIGMPGADGYELIRLVRQREPGRGGHVQAIALTAFARSEDRVRALRAGYQLHLAKPIEPKELAMAISVLLQAAAPIA